MNDKKFFWLKFHENFFKQREIKKMRQVKGGELYIVIYLKLQLLSLKQNGEIYFEETEEDIYEQLSIEIDETIDSIRDTVSFMSVNGLCELEGQDISLIKTKELINVTPDGTIRSQKSRAKKKLLEQEDDTNSIMQKQDATKCNTEKEIDLKKDLKKEKEKKKEKVLEKEEEKEKEEESERRKNIEKEEEKEKKETYGKNDNVLLTDKNYQTLKEITPDADKVINQLSYHIANTGEVFESHYNEILTLIQNK